MPKADFAVCRLADMQFSYPATWTAEISENDAGESAELQSPGATFAIFAHYPSDVDAADIVEEAVNSLREEHPSLELEDADEAPWNDPANESWAQEAVFLTIDTVTYCWLRAWNFGARTVFLMLQSPEREAAVNTAVFRAMCRSLKASSEPPT